MKYACMCLCLFVSVCFSFFWGGGCYSTGRPENEPPNGYRTADDRH